MVKLFIYLLLGSFSLGVNIQKTSSELYPKDNICFSIENFNSTAEYVQTHGEQTNLSKSYVGLERDSSFEITLGNRTILLHRDQYYNRFIVIDKREENKIPTYTVSIEENKIRISAWASRVDSKECIRTRYEDWCRVVWKLKGKK